jgi:hypothetical protein
MEVYKQGYLREGGEERGGCFIKLRQLRQRSENKGTAQVKAKLGTIPY